jgi:hypothetical protein
VTLAPFLEGVKPQVSPSSAASFIKNDRRISKLRALRVLHLFDPRKFDKRLLSLLGLSLLLFSHDDLPHCIQEASATA